MAGYLHFVSNRNVPGVELFYRATNDAETLPGSNIVYERRFVQFRDIRDLKIDELDIDRTGFSLGKSALELATVRTEMQLKDAGAIGDEHKQCVGRLKSL